MDKQFKIFSALGILLITFVVIFHFVPIDNRIGYVNSKGSSAQNLPTLDYKYRWISGGVKGWDDQLSNLHEGVVLDTIGMQKAHVRLYLF